MVTNNAPRRAYPYTLVAQLRHRKNWGECTGPKLGGKNICMPIKFHEIDKRCDGVWDKIKCNNNSFARDVHSPIPAAATLAETDAAESAESLSSYGNTDDNSEETASVITVNTCNFQTSSPKMMAESNISLEPRQGVDDASEGGPTALPVAVHVPGPYTPYSKLNNSIVEFRDADAAALMIDSVSILTSTDAKQNISVVNRSYGWNDPANFVDKRIDETVINLLVNNPCQPGEYLIQFKFTQLLSYDNDWYNVPYRYHRIKHYC
jgi:hypothetical protein